jgi:hypothetical protein
MPDRIALPLLALIAVAMITVALVWPQGQGRRWPGPSAAAPPPSTVRTAAPDPILRPAR